MSEIPPGERLQGLLTAAGELPLSEGELELFVAYFSLILRWNEKTNLTAIRDEEGILSRHFVESIACARALPAGIRTLLDFGSGAGFPGIPISICRPEINVTLAESQGKKAAFLQEAIRTLGLSATVHAGRAENRNAVFDCVVLRAVDRMEQAVEAAAELVTWKGIIALMTTESEFPTLRDAAGPDFSWKDPIPAPGSKERLLAIGQLNQIAS